MQRAFETQSAAMDDDKTIATLPIEQVEIFDINDDIARRLSLLAFVLADPEQELSVQHPGMGATTFTCFLKLPIELRLMIWRAAFPKARKVVLEVQWSFEPYYGCSVPVTLGVNRESRNETKKHYLVYFQTTEVLDGVDLSDSRPHPYILHLCKLEPKPRPIFYSPSRDWLTLNCWEYLRPWPQTLYKIVAERLQHLGRTHAVNIDGHFPVDLPHFSIEESWSNLPALFNFHSLKEIRCVSRGIAIPNTECKETFSKFFNDGFKLERSKFPACEIPKVLFFDTWTQMRANLNG